MKTWTKKRGIAAAAALLLMSVILVIGCSGPETGGGGGYTPPAGMGAIKLNVVNSIGRTILPSAADVDFTAFELNFVGTAASNANDRTIKRELADIGTFINLTPDTYTLTIKGYTDTIGDPTDLDTLTDLVAQGTYTFPVAQGATPTLTVYLYGIDTGGTGTFSWKITDSSGTTGMATAEMDIQAFLSPFASALLVDLKGNHSPDTWDDWIGSHSFTSGYYRVIFNLEDANGTEIIWQQLLHVYNNLTSKFIYEFTPAHFGGKVVKVTFHVNDIADTKVNITYLEGDYIDVSDFDLSKPGITDKDYMEKYVFAGWFTDDGTWSDEVTADSHQLTVDTDVYAKWTEVSAPKPAPIFDDREKAPVLSKSAPGDLPENSQVELSITLTDTVTITVDNFATFDTSSVKWYLDNDYATAINSTVTYIVDVADSLFDTVGRYLLTVEGEVDGMPYSTSIWIKINT